MRDDAKLERIKVGVGLTGEIAIYRSSKRDPRVALAKRNATTEVVVAALRHFLHGIDAGMGVALDVTLDDVPYEIRILPKDQRPSLVLHVLWGGVALCSFGGRQCRQGSAIELAQGP